MVSHTEMRAFLLWWVAVGWLAMSVQAQTNQTAYALAPPNVEVILLRAVTNASRDDEMEARFKARYAYVRTKLTETLDADGELKKRDQRRVEHTPARPDAQDPPSRSACAWSQDRTKRAYERHDIRVTTDLLRRFQFTSVGGEDVAGRPAWVIDFLPASEQLPAHGLLDKFISRTAGRVWIDQADYSVARVRFRLIAPVKVVGGLVGSLKHCEVALDRLRTDDGLWYTQLLTWRIEGRKLLTRQIMTQREEISEVRRAQPVQEVPAGQP